MMAIAIPFQPAQRFDFRLALGIPILLMGLLLLLDPTDLDFAIARLFYEDGTGFIGRRSYWLETVLHDYAKQAVIVLAVCFILAFIASFRFRALSVWRRPLGYVVLAMTLTTAVVPPLKTLTAVHCPWSLAEFGGGETYSPLLGTRAETLKPGRCWPGGHASTGFSLLALFFALRDRHPKGARLALGLALALGTVFSTARMAQGAHFLSHNVWTLLIDWVICVVCYRVVLYQKD
jgi:membrane-associated PAP2 superfamily phosphatase